MGGVRQLSQARGRGLSLTVQWAEFWSVPQEVVVCVFCSLKSSLVGGTRGTAKLHGHPALASTR